jgi:hypothetical protein
MKASSREREPAMRVSGGPGHNHSPILDPIHYNTLCKSFLNTKYLFLDACEVLAELLHVLKPLLEPDEVLRLGHEGGVGGAAEMTCAQK